MNYGKITREIAQGLKVLRKRIAAADIPPSKLDESINVATWNIREFGKKPREKASLYYIAEIINQFDLVAVVEVRDNLSDLAEVLKILGPYWHAVFSDFIADPQGNRERMAYIYDKRAVVFTGLASEADARLKSKKKTKTIDWWRSPYIASFRAGNFDFILITAHIRWGKSEAERKDELQLLADWVDERSREKYVYDKDIIVMGDFNIPSLKSSLYKAISSRGLMMPKVLTGLHGSNLAQDKRYDQILHDPGLAQFFTQRGGVVDFYSPSFKALYPGSNKTKTNLTYELSDHLPLWVQIDVDRSDQKLNQIIKS